MSVRVMSAVWHEAVEYREGPLLVLLALADWANDEGWCWPSVPSIAAKARLTERQVYNVLAQLQEDGVIERASGGGRGKEDPRRPGVRLGNPTRYRIIVAALGRPRGIPDPEVVSGLEPVEKSPENAANPEADCRVSGDPNPEMKAPLTLKSDASLYGRTVIEPSGKANTPPQPPSALRKGARRTEETGVSDPLDPHVEATMQACGWSERRRRGRDGPKRAAIRRQLALAEQRGEEPARVRLAMVAKWKLLAENRHLLRHDWGVVKFLDEGGWREDSMLPWDQRSEREERMRAEARVGGAR